MVALIVIENAKNEGFTAGLFKHYSGNFRLLGTLYFRDRSITPLGLTQPVQILNSTLNLTPALVLSSFDFSLTVSVEVLYNQFYQFQFIISVHQTKLATKIKE